MQDPKPLYIIGGPLTQPQKGIAPHPLLGMGNVRNVDITTNPGSVRLNNLTEKKSGTTVTGQITWMRKDPASQTNIYAIDDANVVYKSTDNGGTWTTVAGNGSGAGQGLEIWKDYLFAIGVGIDIYGPLSGSPSWTNNWNSGTLDYTTQNPTYCQAFKSIDGNLYIANGKYVHKIAENAAPFAPGTAGSYTLTQKAITLADFYEIRVMRDLGSNLMLGTIYAQSDSIADIFPYERGGTLTLGIPIRIAEKGIQAMYTYNNRLYVLAGQTGKLFVTDTVSAQPLAQIPNYIINLDGTTSFNMFPDAIMYQKGKLWFGLGGSALGNLGVWSYNLSTKAIQLENTISTGNDGSTFALYISSLLPISTNVYLIGWRDTTPTASYGIDKLNNSLRYTSYAGYIESPLVKVGEALGNKTQGQLEIALTKPLVSGQGVRIKWRKDLTSSFTTLATIDFATNGGVSAKNVSSATLTNLVFLQIRAELTTGSSNLSPELQSVMLK